MRTLTLKQPITALSEVYMMVNKAITKTVGFVATTAPGPYFAATKAECESVLSATNPPSKIAVRTIIVNESDEEKSWRLVHDGISVIATFESSGLTWTRNNLFTAKDEAGVTAEIERLRLSGAPVALVDK